MTGLTGGLTGLGGGDAAMSLGTRFEHGGVAEASKVGRSLRAVLARCRWYSW